MVESRSVDDKRAPREVAIVTQGGASHSAFAAGAHARLLVEHAMQRTKQPRDWRIMALTGTSGGAICALLSWEGLLKGNEEEAIKQLCGYWSDNTPHSPLEFFWNEFSVEAFGMLDKSAFFPFSVKMTPYEGFLYWAVAGTELWCKVSDLLENWRVSANSWTKFLGWPYEMPKFPISYRERFLNPELLLEAHSGQEGAGPKSPAVTDPLPVLLLGAVDVRSGEFRAFRFKELDSTVPGVSGVRDAALASAAFPFVVTAGKDDKGEERYWDGLFSQNPPIRDLIAVPDKAEEKPDEIWVIQITRQECEQVPHSADAIWDRREELSGNIALNGEIQTIKAVNKWVFEGAFVSNKEYKPIAVHWINIDFGDFEDEWPLEPDSAMNRNRDFITALMEHGWQQAEMFLPMRMFIEEVWSGNARDPLAAASACCVNPSEMLKWVADFQKTLPGGGGEYQLFVDRMEISKQQDEDRWLATVHYEVRSKQGKSGQSTASTSEVTFALVVVESEECPQLDGTILVGRKRNTAKIERQWLEPRPRNKGMKLSVDMRSIDQSVRT